MLDYRLPILFALVVGSQGGPTRSLTASSPSTCSTECSGSSKFKYTPGKTYQYKYEAETRTSLVGVSTDHHTIGLTTIVDIEVQSKCELILKVHDTTLFAYDSKAYSDQDVNKEFSQKFERYPLRFSFQDGSLQAVCPHKSEETWAVNIKKGILSAFQNSMDNFEAEEFKGTESDVTGKCETEYTIAQRGWRFLTVKKSKDLSSCSNRQGFNSAIQTTPFRISSVMKSLPLMRGTHTCTQEVSTSGTLKSALCHEVHVFRPFSTDQGGATTEVTQKLNIVQEKDGVNTHLVECGPTQEPFFEHAPETVTSDLSTRDALDLLSDLCETTATEVMPETSRQFSTLVSLLKRMDFDGLKRVYNQVMRDSFCKSNVDRARKFALDAFPMVGSDASVELMKTLVSNEDVTGKMADMWIASIAFVSNPTIQMIKYAKELLGLPSFETRVLLPLSSMVQSYCRVNPLCVEVEEVQNFIDMLRTNLDGGCKVDQQNFRKIMMTLRALGNTGNGEAIIPALYNCIENTDNPMDVRVAAIQAFRNFRCGADRNNLMGVYRDTTRNPELRIHAYLAVMKCPNEYVIDQIRDTLKTEESNQAGSFVWSHLTNLMESSDPENKPIQRLLGDAVLDREFDLDKMKFSRNYEGSMFSEKFNTGVKTDGNLIWSGRSFIPRSASLNLTVNMFGESMNLLEVGGRVEGLETLLESYFGPVGYYNDDNKGSNEIPDADPKHARLSAKKFKEIKSQARSTRDQLRGALYMRMFGNELSYNMFGASNGVLDDVSGSDMFDFLQKLRNNKPQSFSLTKNIMFVDSTYTVPTVVGLPLKLAVNGTASVALNVGGQVDMKNPLSKVVIDGNFEPSGSVNVDSTMGVDAVVTSGGIKMVSTLYTNSGAKGRIELASGNVLDMAFDITKEKSEIVDIKSAFYMVYNDVEREQSLISDNKHEKSYCTGDRLERATGMQLCISMLAPNTTGQSEAPLFPLSGPTHLGLSLTKLDLPNGYKFEAKYIKTPVMTLFRLMSDTPGSLHNRATGLDVTLKKDDMSLVANLVSPWKKAVLNGQLLDTSQVKGITGDINVDDGDRVYNLDAKVNIDNSKDSVTYIPTLTLEVPDWKNVKVGGKVAYKTGESLESNLVITGATDEPMHFAANAMNTLTKKGILASLNYEKGEGYVFEAMTNVKIEEKKQRSRHTYTPRLYVRTPEKELVELTADMLYISGKSLKIKSLLDKLTKIPFTFTLDYGQSEYTAKKRTKYTMRASLEGPKLKNKLMVLVDNRAQKNIFSKFRLDYDINRRWKDTITGSNRIKLNLYKTKQAAKITGDLNFVGSNDYDSSLSVIYSKKKYTMNLDASLKYGENIKDKKTKDRVDFTLATINKESGKDELVNYTASFKLPSKGVNVKVTGGHIQGDRKVESDVKIQYHPDRIVGFGLRYHNKTNLYHLYSGSLTISLPEDRQMSFAGEFGRETENKYVNNVEFEIIKGRKTKIETALKIATHSMYEVEVGLSLPDLEPVRVIGAYNMVENGYTGEASYKKGGKVYRIFGEVLYELGKTGKVMLDFTVPSRRVMIITAMSSKGTEKHGMLDVQWNADVNMEERFLTNITYDIKSMDDFEISTTLYYPTRTVDFSMKHNTADRYITNVELSWSPEEKFKFFIIFRDDLYNGAGRTELDVGFESPFKRYEDLSLSVSIISGEKQLQSKSSLTWARKKKILVSTTVKLPVTANSVDMVGTILTPFDDYETLAITFKHRLQDQLQTSALLQWGKNRFSVSTDGQFTANSLTRSFNGTFALHTPFEPLRVLVIKGAHNDNYKDFKASMTMEKQVASHTDEFDVELSFTLNTGVPGLQTITMLNNRGLLRVTTPNDKIDADWELRQQPDMFKALLDIRPMRGNRFKIEFGENHSLMPTENNINAKFELLIPMEELRELSITFDHQNKPGSINTRASVIKDNLEIMTANVNLLASLTIFDLNTLITSRYSEDIVFKLSSIHSIMPYRGNFELSWGNTPWKITAASELFYNQFGNHEATFSLNTPVPHANVITVFSKRQRNGLNWETSTKVSFNEQSIQCHILYRFDHVKFTQINLRSTFPQFPGVTTALRLEGTKTNFNGDANFEMVPYVGKINTDFKWSYYQGSRIFGEFNLNTVYPQYPYLKASFDSNPLGVSRVSKFSLEYLPTQVVTMDLDYRYTSAETIEGTLKITSPYTNNKEVVAGFTHNGNLKNFHTIAKISSEHFPGPASTEARFALTNGVKSTFKMDSYWRGYEKVRWNLIHENTDTGYHTVAEYETNDKSISYENLLKVKKNDLDWQITFLTPFANITRTHIKLEHQGEFPNTQTHAEVAYNENMITSDFDLTHNDEKSIAKAVVTTPFERYENIHTTISKTGSLSDFTATAECNYSLRWHGTLQHKFHPNEVHTSALLRIPYLPDDVSLAVNYTGKLTDFRANLDYVLNPNYRTIGEARFLYNLPDLHASAKTTTMIDNDVRVNEIALKHHQNVDRLESMDISSQLLAQMRDKRVNINFNFDHTLNGEDRNVKINTIVELPHPDFAYSRLHYSSKEEMLDTISTKDLELSFETPLLEKYIASQLTTMNTSPVTVDVTTTHTYGDQIFMEQQHLEEGKISYTYTTPFEGYEKNSLEILYEPISFNATVTSSAFTYPLKSSGIVSSTVDHASLSALDFNSKISYDTMELFGLMFALRPDMTSGRLAFIVDEDFTLHWYTWEGKMSTESKVLSLKSLNFEELSLTRHTGETLTFTENFKLKSIKDFEISQKLESTFTVIPNMEMHVKNEKVDGEYKPLVRFYSEHSNPSTEIELNGALSWELKDMENVKAFGGVGLKTTFNELTNFNIKLGHEHGIAPFKIGEIALIEYNDKKYFDLETEFGALNKFSGLIAFHAPREMEFSFSGVNEGESVNGNLQLNWDKTDADSVFGMQFDFDNTATSSTRKKDLSVRVTRLGRIMSFSTSQESSRGRMAHSGKVYWDEGKNQGAGYSTAYTWMNVQGVETHSTDLSVFVPTRNVEITGQYIQKGSKILTIGTVHWDADKDRQKAVEVKLEVAPTEIRKMALLGIRLPSMDKELTLTTELSVNDGPRLLEGETKFTYSPDLNKAVLLKYIIQDDSKQWTEFRAGWSVDHADTQTHIEMMANMTGKGDNREGNVMLSYGEEKNKVTSLTLHGDLDLQQKQVNVKLSSHKESVSLRGAVTSQSPYLVTMETSRNNEPRWKTDISLDTDIRTLEATMTYDDMSGKVITKALMLNDTAVLSETNTKGSYDTTQEGRLYAQLSERVLHGHLKWRPEVISEVTTYGAKVLQQTVSELSPVVESSLQELGTVLQQKHKAISASLEAELSPLGDSYELEVKSVQREVRQMRRELKRMYKQNELYLQDLEVVYDGFVKNMMANYAVAIARMESMYKRVQETLREISNKIEQYPFQEKYNALVKSISDGIKDGEAALRLELATVVSEMVAGLDKLSDMYNEAITDISLSLRELIEALLKELTMKPYLDDVKAALDRLTKGVDISSIDHAQIVQKIQTMLDDVLRTDSIPEKLRLVQERTREILAENFGDLMDNKDVQDVQKAITDLYQQLTWVYEYTDMKMSLKELLQSLSDKLRSKVLEEFNQLPIGLLDLHKSKVTTFDLQKGEIEFDLYLPIPVENFDELMSITVDKYMTKIEKMVDKYFPRRDICLWDLYYSLPHVQWSHKDWVPPFDVDLLSCFTAFGTISGKQHLTTFDGHHYDLAGLCSYVLATDLDNSNFSVVLKYTGGPRNLAKESIITMVDGRTVEILQNYMVMVDNKPTELPYYTDRLSIVRSGSKVTLSSKVGLVVMSDFKNDYHLVHLSGWYFNKVGGLFGNFDYEHSNDVMTPDGIQEAKLRRYFNTWEVDASCKSTRIFVDPEVTKRDETCTAVFEATTSNLRPCFLHVEPSHYRLSCDSDPSAVCDMATLYREMCAKHGVDVYIPSQCVQCESHSQKQFDSSERLRYEKSSPDGMEPVKSMDVVVVVEEGRCNQDIKSKLRDVVITLEQTLEKSGMRGNQYGVVGYSDEVVSHTMEGQLFNEGSKVAMGLENLRYQKNLMTSDPLAAVMYATSLPFRTGVKKSIVLASCSLCQTSDSYAYSRLNSLLQQRDITLHVLREKSLMLKTNRQPKSQIYGLSRERVYYGEQHMSEQDLFPEMDVPTDLCVSLALQSNGTLFDTGNLQIGSVSRQREFMKTVGEQVQQQTGSPCQVCSCELNKYGLPQSVCRRCDSQPVNFQPPVTLVKKLTDLKNTITHNVQALLY
ncbi:APLP-like protein [Mya arenaria]|uniref:APLP-like protein n=1 Tax=Mya arenaria TaxID=6604 RepID=A0ABY7FNE1_MYAAR|nr:APLP-like protein [Mya arenaria]